VKKIFERKFLWVPLQCIVIIIIIIITLEGGEFTPLAGLIYFLMLSEKAWWWLNQP